MGHKKSETVRFNPAGILMFSAFVVEVCMYTLLILFFHVFFFSQDKCWILQKHCQSSEACHI